jgi:D-serine deaminase-like pyridoxal phosphate-dependent protein
MTQRSFFRDIDTPALIIDRDVMLRNLKEMQQRADRMGVALRPHTKTHKMPALARLQLELGAGGIAVAKLGEAEAMADAGIDDIFVANVLYGEIKLQRLLRLARRVKIRVGVDCTEQADSLQAAFAGESAPLEVLMEIDVGEKRSGVDSPARIEALGRHMKGLGALRLCGVFSHEGQLYQAQSRKEIVEATQDCHRKTVQAAAILRGLGHPARTVSVGSTPSLMQTDAANGVTEIRPGTYIFMDAAQCAASGGLDRAAATVLATVISRPAQGRVVLDCGAKALTAQQRSKGLCATPGYGLVKGTDVRIARLYDEHGVVEDTGLWETVRVGDKLEIIPNHICPVVNLYDEAYVVFEDRVVEVLSVACRGRIQ